MGFSPWNCQGDDALTGGEVASRWTRRRGMSGGRTRSEHMPVATRSGVAGRQNDPVGTELRRRDLLTLHFFEKWLDAGFRCVAPNLETDETGEMLEDPLFWILVLPGLLLGSYGQWQIKANVAKYSQLGTKDGITGAEVARKLLGLQRASRCVRRGHPRDVD